MNDDSLDEEEIFDRAISIEDPDARAAFLDQACQDDRRLRASIEQLLSFHNTPDRLNSPFAPSPATNDAQPGTRLGRYRIVERISEGGFGSVFRAEQLEPVRRQVAIKVMRPGLNSREIIERFEAERQALALMSHPHIATVLDAGTTETGRPYFVMELVDGPPIDEYCDSARLAVTERLHLFLWVCRAIQHAHQKGIVHRDIKPSNVLVARDPVGPAVPKIIDFGIAKALFRFESAAASSELRSMLGTPDYMSPEQLSGATDVDTRADIYGLGGMLYKLLTGSAPLTLSHLATTGFEDIRRTIREVEPIPPSAWLDRCENQSSVSIEQIGRAPQSTSVASISESRAAAFRNASVEELAAARNTTPSRLRRVLRGELDWIVLKALAKDRERRYETASEFARDIERYLNQQPVLAGPRTRWYAARKFVRRNRVTVAAAGLVTAAVSLGGVLATVGFVRAERERQYAEQQWLRAEGERSNAEQARQLAVHAGTQAQQAQKIAEREQANALNSADKAERVADLLSQLLGASHPEHGHPASYTVRQLLDDFAQSVGQQLEGQAEIEATVRRTIGRSYLAIGDQDRAGPHLERALELRRQTFGEENALTAQSQADYALYLASVPRLREAEQLARSTLKTLGNVEPSDELIDAYYVLAHVHHEYGDRDVSRQYSQQAWSLSEQLRGGDHPVTISLQSRVALSMPTSSGREAETMARDALNRMKAIAPAHHALVGQVQSRLARILLERRHFEECEELLQQSIAVHRNALGPNSPLESIDLLTLAELQSKTGRQDEAETTAREAVRIADRSIVTQITLRAWAHRTLAIVLQGTRPSESTEHWARSIELRRQAVGDQTEVTRLLRQHAFALRLIGRSDEAANQLRDAAAICKAASDQRRLTGVQLELVEALREAGRLNEAGKVLRETIDLLADKDESPFLRDTLIETLIAEGAVAEAESEASQFADQFRDREGTFGHAMSQTARARVMLARGDHQQAETVVRAALQSVRWQDHPHGRFRANLVLAQCLIRSSRFEEAESLLLRLSGRVSQQYMKGERDRRVREQLVDLYTTWGKPEEAARWQGTPSAVPVE